MQQPTLDDPGSKVLSPKKLAHVVLRTDNFEEMRTFYKTFLGGYATFENDFLSFQTYDEENHRIAIVNMPDIGKKTSASGLEHIAFTFPTLTELAIAYLQRKNNGIVPFWTINHGPTTSLYYKDPDGNVLETQVENFDGIEQDQAFMSSKAYEINPIGVDFEMDDLIRRLQAGEDDASIKKRPESGPRDLATVPQ